VPYAICYIEGKPGWIVRFPIYPLLQDTHIYQIQKRFEIAVPQSHWLDNEASNIFSQTNCQFDPASESDIGLCERTNFDLTLTCTHCILGSGRSFSLKCGSSQRGIALREFRKNIGSSYIKSAYCVRFLCNLLLSGGRIRSVVYILNSSSITKEDVHVFSMDKSYAALSV